MHLYELDVLWNYLNQNHILIYFMRCINMDYTFMNLIKYKMFVYSFYVMHLYEFNAYEFV